MMILKRILELQLMILIAARGEARTGDPAMRALRKLGGRGKCANQRIAFDKQVLLTFLGRAEDISTVELCTLEQTFASSYNALTASTCTFRIIDTVTALMNFTDGLATPSAQSSTNPSALSGIRFQIIGHCQGCKNNLNLFTRDTSRRLQAVIDGTLPFVDGIAGTPIEVDPAVCDASVNTFENVVILPLYGNPDLISDSEKQSLAEGFLMAYNSLTQGSFCDPLFRTVVDVFGGEVVPQQQGVAASTARLRYLQSRTTGAEKYSYKIIVTGQCRGCPPNTKLFNDAVRRRSLVMSSSGSIRHMITDNECFCPTNFVDARAPTAEEFSVVFNQTLALLDLPHVVAVVGIVEDYDSNSSFPTPASTSAPVQAPLSISTVTPSSVPVQAPLSTSAPVQAPLSISTVTQSSVPVQAPLSTSTSAPDDSSPAPVVSTESPISF